jgi:type III secretion protein R
VNAPADLLARPITLIIALGIATILPFAFMTLTAFVKISTVLQIVRGAIGAQNVPSSTVIMAFAGALTILAMAPLGTRLSDRVAPLLAPSAQAETAEWLLGVTAAAKEPIGSFLQKNASERERRRFFEIARAARPSAERELVKPNDLSVIVPAFVVTELLAAFALGFAIYLPFLVIDLVVANVLLALGMQMLSPSQVSLPFKLLLFVAIDGWGLLAQTLVAGYKF